MRATFHVALADCRERFRRFGLVAVVSLAAFLGYQVIAGVLVMRLGSYRGVDNAAWIGTLMATALSFFLSLVGFYFARGNVEQDRRTGVGRVLAATPLRASEYVFGTFLGHVAVLSVVILTLVVASAVMLGVHGDGSALEIRELVLPFIAFTFPVALGVAAVSVFFDVAPILREPVGIVVYFFVWLAVLPTFGGAILGFDEIERSMGQAILAQGGDYRGGVAFGTPSTVEMRTFIWTGFDWLNLIAARLLATAVVLVAVLSGAGFLHHRERFDPTRSRWTLRREPGPAVETTGTLGTPAEALAGSLSAELSAPAVVAGRGLNALLAILVGEFRVSAKGRPILWYVIAAGLFIASIVAPIEAVRRTVLPLLWVWPVLIMAEMGVRESRHGVEMVLRSCPSPVFRQLWGTWAAGFSLTLILGSGVLYRFISIPAYLPAFFAGAVFVPSLALFLGVAFRTERLFPIVLIILWYVGSVNGVAAFDFTGATDAAALSVIPGVYGAIGAAMASASFIIRAVRSSDP